MAVTIVSVIPCRLNGDLHEWFNEIVTVPNQNLLKLLSGEQTGDTKREAKTLWTFTATCCCGFMISTQNKQENTRSFGEAACHNM